MNRRRSSGHGTLASPWCCATTGSPPNANANPNPNPNRPRGSRACAWAAIASPGTGASPASLASGGLLLPYGVGKCSSLGWRLCILSRFGSSPMKLFSWGALQPPRLLLSSSGVDPEEDHEKVKSLFDLRPRLRRRRCGESCDGRVLVLQLNSWRRAAARCLREEYTCSRSSCVWAYGLVLTRDRRRSSTPREGLHLFDSAPPPQRSTQTRTPLWPDIAAQAHAAVHHASFCLRPPEAFCPTPSALFCCSPSPRRRTTPHLSSVG